MPLPLLTPRYPFLIRSRCPEGEYNDLASLLLSPATDVVKALFLRGAPEAIGVHALAIAFLAWLALTTLTAGAPMPMVQRWDSSSRSRKLSRACVPPA